jgi:uncharacterized coiled-coil protein SlyX
MSQEVVASIRAKYPTPLGASHALFLLEVAATLKGGLLKKTGGTVVRLPDDTTVAQDIFCEPPVSGVCVCWDILKDGEGVAEPVWNRSDDQPEVRYYAVTPGPGPDPKPPPDSELDARVIALEAHAARQDVLNAGQAARNHDVDEKIRTLALAMAERLDALDERLKTQEARKIPTVAKGRVITSPFIAERTLPLE